MDEVEREGDGVFERKREVIAQTIPKRYSPWFHLAAPSSFGLAVCITALLRIHAPTWIELIVFPLTLVFGFAFEWRVHKSVLHQRKPGLGILYVRHELHHHVAYRHYDMAMRSPRELYLILMPPYAIVLVACVDAPLAILLYLAWSVNAAMLYLVGSMLFFLAYELLHAAYHVPETHFIGRLSLVRTLRELHRTHHDPSLMKRWNFNVTVPLFDWLHGTLWSPERAERRAAERARTRDAHG
ncbi:MAG: sterol desaturase family protein [Polyangiaceae bacterium]